MSANLTETATKGPDHAARRERLRRLMLGRNLDALLVSYAANRFYLSGFELHDPQFNESAGVLVITRDGRDWLATDARYKDASLRLWDQDRVFIYKSQADELPELLRRCGSHIGFEARAVSHATARKLSGRGLWLEAADGLVERLRKLKDKFEIAALERSFAINHQLLEWIGGELVPGRSEAETSWLIERYFRENGASELAFASIVAVGPNSALPHAIPGHDKIMENGPVLIDVGCRVDDYCSDQTRTFWVGNKQTDEFARTMDLVRQSQDAALKIIRPGLEFADAYHAACQVFEQAGVREYFTHGLGHGVGLETHEAPSLSPRARGKLEAGMTVTVEPGLYYPQWGGIRWEYTVLVEDDGPRIL